MVQINDKRLDNVYYVNSSLNSPHGYSLKTNSINNCNIINSIKNIENNIKVIVLININIIKTLRWFYSHNKHYLTFCD